MIRDITVKMRWGEQRQVRAKVVGNLAIHRAQPNEDQIPIWLYALTHVPTGASLYVATTLPSAQRALQAFSSLDVDWSSADMQNYYELSDTAQEIARDLELQEWADFCFNRRAAIDAAGGEGETNG